MLGYGGKCLVRLPQPPLNTSKPVVFACSFTAPSLRCNTNSKKAYFLPGVWVFLWTYEFSSFIRCCFPVSEPHYGEKKKLRQSAGEYTHTQLLLCQPKLSYTLISEWFLKSYIKKLQGTKCSRKKTLFVFKNFLSLSLFCLFFVKILPPYLKQKPKH